MTLRALVTGGSGFVGSHLLPLLERDRIECMAYNLTEGHDVRDYETLRAVVERWQPDLVFHLAAQAYVAEAAMDPQRATEVNVLGTANLLEAVRRTGCSARILIAGTSEEYNYDQAGGVITEATATDPVTPYGASKAAASLLGRAFHRTYGMPIVVTRAFNHTGPGQSPSYAVSAFARRVALAEAGQLDVIEHGDLSAERDYCDVRDVVRAYRAAIMAEPGVYNVCSGHIRSIGSILEDFCRAARQPVVTMYAERLARAGTQLTRFGASHDKLTAATGWAPEISWQQTAADLLAYWRERT